MSEKREQVYEALKEILSEVKSGVIKDFEMPTLCNVDTGQNNGYAVILTLSNKYDYTSTILENWRKRLGAIIYMISVRRNQLIVRFNVMNN